MRKLILSAALSAAFVGVALAQVEASSSTYFLDIDPARYAGPASQRLALRVGDQPRHISFGDKDEVCVQLQRVTGQEEVINARIRTLRPESQIANVRVVAPDISPGTYRSTPWGMLIRATPQRGDAEANPVTFKEAPVCTI
jgi:hypothetical protein